MAVGVVLAGPGLVVVSTKVQKVTTLFGTLASACLFVSRTAMFGTEKGTAIHSAREAPVIGSPTIPAILTLYALVQEPPGAGVGETAHQN